MEPKDAHITTKITKQSNNGTHKTEDILEGESLVCGVLGSGGRYSNARERVAMPRQAGYSCSSSIIFFLYFNGDVQEMRVVLI